MDISTLVYSGLAALALGAWVASRKTDTATEVVPIPVRVDDRRR